MNDSKIPAFFVGFVFGALIGAAAALLLAPQSGEDTRTQLRDRGMEFRGKAQETYDQARERITATAEEMRLRASDTATKIGEAIPHGKVEPEA